MKSLATKFLAVILCSIFLIGHCAIGVYPKAEDANTPEEGIVILFQDPKEEIF